MINPLGAGTQPKINLLPSRSQAPTDLKSAHRIKKLSQDNIDWNYLLSLAGRHGRRLID
jgi:hypothetical protein